MGEWLIPAVLKTVDGETRPGVRIPLPPPNQIVPIVSRLDERVLVNRKRGPEVSIETQSKHSRVIAGVRR